MRNAAITFLLVAVVAGSFAFGGLTGFAATIAKTVAAVFLSLSAIGLVLQVVVSLAPRMRLRAKR